MLSIVDKETVRSQALSLGACACGFAAAAPVSQETQDYFSLWLSQGRNGSMDYCERYCEVRNDPRLLLPDAHTVVCCAFAYPHKAGRIASYALGDDYHYVVKAKLNELGVFLTERWGGEYRAVVDSAPMHERYWAQQSGIGFEGINNMIIIPGVGSYVFLGELLWTGEIPADEPCKQTCQGCLACVNACPGHALDSEGHFDARKCVSYLTIEHRGELPEDANLGGSIYGCECCQRVCPHNHCNPASHSETKGHAPSLPEFAANPEIEGLTDEEILTMTPSHYKKLTAHSAMRRIPLTQLRRNLLASKKQS